MSGATQDGRASSPAPSPRLGALVPRLEPETAHHALCSPVCKPEGQDEEFPSGFSFQETLLPRIPVRTGVWGEEHGLGPSCSLLVAREPP